MFKIFLLQCNKMELLKDFELPIFAQNHLTRVCLDDHYSKNIKKPVFLILTKPLLCWQQSLNLLAQLFTITENVVWPHITSSVTYLFSRD